MTKKPKLALGFTFVPDRYDDDTKKVANAPSAFKNTKLMSQIANGIKSIIKKPKLALGFTFVPDRYDDDAEKAANAPSAF